MPVSPYQFLLPGPLDGSVLDSPAAETTAPAALSVHVHRWLPATGTPKAALVIVHGMSEHGGRYARLAEVLNRRGYAVYAPDLPGHGLSVRAERDRGWVDDQHGWSLMLGVIHRVRQQAASDTLGEALDAEPTTAAQADRPVFMFGHSMGSFLLQHYLIDHGAGLAGAILSATSGTQGPLRSVGLTLLRGEGRALGLRHPSALAEMLTFKSFNRQFAPNRTPFDWLSRDTAEVDAYIADPLCGKRSSVALWIDLLRAGENLLDPQRLGKIPHSLPIRLVAGDRDPVSLGAKGPNLLAKHYWRAGLSDVSVRIWPQGRHELLNDRCRDEVHADLASWLDLRLRRQPLSVIPTAEPYDPDVAVRNRSHAGCTAN